MCVVVVALLLLCVVFEVGVGVGCSGEVVVDVLVLVLDAVEGEMKEPAVWNLVGTSSDCGRWRRC